MLYLHFVPLVLVRGEIASPRCVHLHGNGCLPISGADNEEADALSRWNLTSDPPCSFRLDDGFLISLDDLWASPLSVSLHPVDTNLLWQLPT